MRRALPQDAGCSGVAKAVADIDAMDKKEMAAKAKKFLAGRKTARAAKVTALAGAKKDLADFKAANAGGDTKALEAAVDKAQGEADAAEKSVLAASATVTTGMPSSLAHTFAGFGGCGGVPCASAAPSSRARPRACDVCSDGCSPCNALIR